MNRYMLMTTTESLRDASAVLDELRPRLIEIMTLNDLVRLGTGIEFALSALEADLAELETL